MPIHYISPYPKGEEFRRRAMQSHGRNTWKQPEPPPPQKPKQWFVLGIEVDYNTYREYNYEKSWPIDGDVLKGIPCALWSLENWATDEHAKDCPIEAENARKILDSIRTEIQRKEQERMKKIKDASDFMEDLKKIYTESREAYEALQSKGDLAKKAMDQAYKEWKDPSCDNKQLAELRYNVARGEYTLAENARREEYKSIIATHEQKVAELRTQFADYLDERYSASPEALDSATMQFLNSGICKASELAKLVDRHAGNPTMLRIIGSYADKMLDDKRLSHDDHTMCTLVKQKTLAAQNGNRELALFDSAVSAAKYGLQSNSVVADRMNKHISEWFDDFREQMENLPNVPTDALGADTE